MSVATYEGFIENGKVRLPDNICIPERAKVFVVVPSGQIETPAALRSPRLVRPEQAEDFRKEVVEGSSDAGL